MNEGPVGTYLASRQLACQGMFRNITQDKDGNRKEKQRKTKLMNTFK